MAQTNQRRSASKRANRSPPRPDADIVTLALPRRIVNSFEAALNSTRRFFTELQDYALSGGQLESESVPAAPPNRNRAAPRAPQPRRARGTTGRSPGRPRNAATPASATPAQQPTARRGAQIDRNTLGREKRVIDRVFNALPVSGTINIERLTAACGEPQPRPQDVGRAIKDLTNLEIVSRVGDDVTVLQQAARAA